MSKKSKLKKEGIFKEKDVILGETTYTIELKKDYFISLYNVEYFVNALHAAGIERDGIYGYGLDFLNAYEKHMNASFNESIEQYPEDEQKNIVETASGDYIISKRYFSELLQLNAFLTGLNEAGLEKRQVYKDAIQIYEKWITEENEEDENARAEAQAREDLGL